MATVSYKIAGKHDAAAIDSAKKGLTSLGDSVNKLNGVFKALIGAAVIKQVGKAINDTIKAFEIQQNALANLSNAIKNNVNLTAASFQRLVSFTGELQKKGIFGDEELQKQAAYLASMGLTEDKIKSVLEASANLAATGIMPLDSAVKNMAKQFGGMAGELGKQIPALRDLTEEQLKAGEGIALVQRQFAGSLETAASTLEGKTKQVTNIIGDIKEKIGSTFGVAKMGLLTSIQPFLEVLDKWLADNQERIISFFYRLPEIVAASFKAITDIQKRVMSLDYWVAYFKNLGSFMVGTFKLAFNVIANLIIALGTALWEPLKYGFELFIADIKFLFAKVVNFFSDGLNNALNAVIDKFNSLPEWMRFGKTIDNVANNNRLNENIPKPAPYGASVINAFSRIGTTLTTDIEDLVETYTKVWIDGFGEIVVDLTSELDRIIGKDLPETLKQFLGSTSTAAEKSYGNNNRNNDDDEEENKIFGSVFEGGLFGDMSTATLWREIFDSLTGPKQITEDMTAKEAYYTAGFNVGRDIGKALGELFNPVALFDRLVSGIGSVFTSIESFIGPELFAMLAPALAPMTALMGPMALLIPVFEGLVSVLGPAIESTVEPLISALTTVGITLGQALLPILDALTPVFSILGNMLLTNLIPIINILTPFIQLIASLLEVILLPILKALAIAFEILMSPIKYIGDLFMWAADQIAIAVHNLNEALNNILTPNKANYKKNYGFSSDAFSGLGQRIDNIWRTTSEERTAPTASSGGGGQSASYSGARDITINVSIDRSAIADLRDIALIIRNEIKSAEALGY